MLKIARELSSMRFLENDGLRFRVRRCVGDDFDPNSSRNRTFPDFFFDKSHFVRLKFIFSIDDQSHRAILCVREVFLFNEEHSS